MHKKDTLLFPHKAVLFFLWHHNIQFCRIGQTWTPFFLFLPFLHSQLWIHYAGIQQNKVTIPFTNFSPKIKKYSHSHRKRHKKYIISHREYAGNNSAPSFFSLSHWEIILQEPNASCTKVPFPSFLLPFTSSCRQHWLDESKIPLSLLTYKLSQSVIRQLHI